MKRRDDPQKPKPTRRARGKQLLADLASLADREAALLQSRSEVDLALATLAQERARKLREIGANEVELSTAARHRHPPAPPVREVSDMAGHALRSVLKVIG